MAVADQDEREHAAHGDAAAKGPRAGELEQTENGADGDEHDGRALEPGDALAQEEERQHDRQDGARFIDGNDLVHVAELQRAEIAQPRRAGHEAREDQKDPRLRAQAGDGRRGATMATISHENSRTTIVRMAVAVSESVFRMPHFARMDVSPAKSAEPNANRIHMTMPSSYILFSRSG